MKTCAAILVAAVTLSSLGACEDGAKPLSPALQLAREELGRAIRDPLVWRRLSQWKRTMQPLAIGTIAAERESIRERLAQLPPRAEERGRQLAARYFACLDYLDLVVMECGGMSAHYWAKDGYVLPHGHRDPELVPEACATARAQQHHDECWEHRAEALWDALDGMIAATKAGSYSLNPLVRLARSAEAAVCACSDTPCADAAYAAFNVERDHLDERTLSDFGRRRFRASVSRMMECQVSAHRRDQRLP